MGDNMKKFRSGRNLVKGLAVAALLSVGATPVGAQELVQVPTFTPQDYTDILTGRYKAQTVSISGTLYMPGSASGAVPGVVIMHGSGGIKGDTEIAVAEALQKAGIAALVTDSFTGRGFSSTGGDQGKLPMAATVLDGFQALLALRAQKGIDGARIGVVGFSRGGVAAMFSNQEPLRHAVLGDAAGFKAHVPVYPGCSTQWDEVKPTAAPVLFLLGEKDDLTPAAKCERYADRIKSAGGTADFVVYPGVSHGFLRTSQSRDYSSANFANCDLGISGDGEMNYPKLGISVAGDWRGFVRKVFRDCGKKGFVLGGTQESHDKAIADIVDFFKKTL